MDYPAARGYKNLQALWLECVRPRRWKCSAEGQKVGWGPGAEKRGTWFQLGGGRAGHEAGVGESGAACERESDKKRRVRIDICRSESFCLKTARLLMMLMMDDEADEADEAEERLRRLRGSQRSRPARTLPVRPFRRRGRETSLPGPQVEPRVSCEWSAVTVAVSHE